jgi:hypothetical protein
VIILGHRLGGGGELASPTPCIVRCLEAASSVKKWEEELGGIALKSCNQHDGKRCCQKFYQ